MKSKKAKVNNIVSVIYELPSEESVSHSKLKSKDDNEINSCINKNLEEITIQKSKSELSRNFKFPKKHKNSYYELHDSFDTSKKPEDSETFSMSSQVFDNQSFTISFKSAFLYFQKKDLKKEQEIVNKEKKFGKKNCCEKICSCFYFIQIPHQMKLQKNLIQCISKVKYDENDEIHFKILQSIYMFFTREKGCAKKGTHWEKIGFQSDTPETDLRATGMMSPLQILYLLCYFPKFSIEFYDFFLKEKCEWLFAVSLINISYIDIVLLKENKMDKYFDRKNNKENEVIKVFNESYIGMVVELNNEIRKKVKKLTAEYISECIEKIRKNSNKIDVFLGNALKIITL